MSYEVSKDPEMQFMFESAEREGLWFHCAYQDLWFSPAELRDEHARGRFQWGPVNWQLLNPAEHLRQLERERDAAAESVRIFQERMERERRRA